MQYRPSFNQVVQQLCALGLDLLVPGGANGQAGKVSGPLPQHQGQRKEHTEQHSLSANAADQLVSEL
jgi:hypothetical protein